MTLANLPASLTHALLLLSALAGFAALALAMERHQEDLWGKALSAQQTRGLRAAGWLLLGLCLALAIAAKGWSFGLVAYSGHTSAAAALVFIALLVWSRVQELRKARAKAAGTTKVARPDEGQALP